MSILREYFDETSIEYKIRKLSSEVKYHYGNYVDTIKIADSDDLFKCVEIEVKMKDKDDILYFFKLKLQYSQLSIIGFEKAFIDYVFGFDHGKLEKESDFYCAVISRRMDFVADYIIAIEDSKKKDLIRKLSL
ncbi:MAG TPA: hypothetical protein VHC91_05780 [Trinickia sp.]|uniref:hypothetical protein n=1 Tax=Trinickia sp. TaxID=2571163 RepID=UPI002BDC8BAB|nr:hypothetical protein [Trinickia sp.]HVW49902.1 hypothetical protein [Trinickia sp.]